MKKLLYLCYYDTDENREKCRYYAPPARNKVTYICSAINRAGWDVEIVSPSPTSNRAFCPGEHCRVLPQTTLKLFHSLGMGGKIKRGFRRIFISCQLITYIMRNIRRGENLLVYHSLVYMKMVKALKRLMGFRLILEVEEIYSDVTGNKKMRERELAFFKEADAFLFPAEVLEELVNTTHKPMAIVYGTYQVEPDRRARLVTDGIRLLYAGTLSPMKAGAYIAVGAAKELPQGYDLRILGTGTKQQINRLQCDIAAATNHGGASVEYDGFLSGEEFIKYLQNCHVGLSTQDSDAAFNDTSFPSKVLTYLANGLRVVSARIKVLERSKIADLIYFYDENSPRAIAKTIESIDFMEPYDSRPLIKQLDGQFIRDIKRLLEAK